MEKHCNRCDVTKDVEDFSVAKNRSFGRHSICKECNTAAAKKWRENNREQYNAYFVKRKKVDEQFRSQSIVYVEDWRKRNPAKKAAHGAAWSRRNLRKIAAKNERRRARQILAPVNDLTVEQLQDRFLEFNGHCAYCLNQLVPGRSTHMDHVQPLSRGGSHTLDNVVPACATCNCTKGAKTLLEFIVSQQGFALDIAA